MTPERWLEIDRLLDAALELAPQQRSAFLDKECATDPSLRREVESLLAAHDDASDKFLAVPAIDIAAKERARDRSQFLLGQMLGPYRVESVLGIGGMGEVYLARDTRLDRAVALKLLPEDYTQDADRVKRFELEARAASTLNHPNIITIYEIAKSDDQLFIATEYIDGETLRTKLDSVEPMHTLSIKDSLEVAIQVASGLSAAHEAGIVHRDIKPENVMIRRDGYAKILDFGLVKLTEARRSLSGRSSIGLRTSPGTILGTVSYMSPEQAAGFDVDHRTDIFSSGVVLYEMLVGAKPFKGESSASILDAILSHQVTFSPQLKLGGDLEKIVSRALEKDRELRYQTAADLRSDLKRVLRDLESLSGGRAAAPVPAPVDARRTRSRWLWPTLMAVFLAVIGIVVAWKWPWRTTREADWSRARAVRLTSLPGEELFPSISPDGKDVVYARRDRNGGWDIFSQRVGGGNARNLTPDSEGSDTHPAYSPDGDRIAFSSERSGGGLFTMGSSGESAKKIASGPAYHPSWSPDGKYILYTEEWIDKVADRTVKPRQLWKVEVATGQKRLISQADIAQPQWSPRGLRIAYWGQRENADRDIWTMKSDGTDPVAITNDVATDWNPVWAPDGKYLYFASDRGGSMNLWRVAIDEETGQAVEEPESISTPSVYSQHVSLSRDGRRLCYVQKSPTYAIQRFEFDPDRGVIVGQPTSVFSGSRQISSGPDLSPDGAWLAYSSFDNEAENIFVIASDGSGQPIQLTDDKAVRNRVPEWSPDGKRIAFYSNRSQQYQIWSINADGSDARQLTDLKRTRAFYPIWFRSGDRMIFTGTEGVPYLLDLGAGGEAKELLPKTDPQQVFWPRSLTSDDKFLLGAWRKSPADKSQPAIFSLEKNSFELFPETDLLAHFEWLNDDRHFLYSLEGRIYVMDRQTKKNQLVLDLTPHRLFRFSVSPENNRIFLSVEFAQSDIWMLRHE